MYQISEELLEKGISEEGVVVLETILKLIEVTDSNKYKGVISHLLDLPTAKKRNIYWKCRKNILCHDAFPALKISFCILCDLMINECSQDQDTLRLIASWLILKK